MLPVEVLKVIFGALSMDALDALMLTTVQFRDIVLRDFSKEPYRYFEALDIGGHTKYKLFLPTGDSYFCKDDDDFTWCMQLGRVDELVFSHPVLDINKFELLLPFKDAWRDGHVHTPRFFSSQSLFDRAFSELLFCKSMVVSIPDDKLSLSFLSLPAVRECSSLDIFELPRSLTSLEIVDWLNVDARSKEPKRLDIIYDVLGGSVENLVEQLKMDFIGSKTACCYVTEIYAGPGTSYHGRFVNKDTLEVLIIRDETVPRRVIVERKPTDEKQ